MLSVVGVMIVLLSALTVFRFKEFSMTVQGQGTRVALACFGILVTACSLYLITQKPNDEETLPTANDYEVMIAYPPPNAKVISVNVQGTIRKSVPRGYKLWVFRLYGDGSFYPLRECLLNEGNDRWEADGCDIGGKNGDKRSLSVNIVGPDALALISYMHRSRQVFKPIRDQLVTHLGNDDVSYMPPAQLKTRDMIQCDSVKVERG